MRTTIDDTRGVVTHASGSGFTVNGVDANPLNTINTAVTSSVSYTFNSGSGGTWTDLTGVFSVASGASALTSEAYQNGFVLLFMRHDQDDQLSMLYQMPHGWAQNTIEPNFHWMPCSAPTLNTTQSIDLGYQLAWLTPNVPDQVFPTTWTTGSLLLPVSASMLNIQQVTEVSTSGFAPPPGGNNTSSLLLLRLMRSGSVSPRDTYTTSKPGAGTAQANMAMLSIDVHYQSTRAGSSTEWGPQ